MISVGRPDYLEERWDGNTGARTRPADSGEGTISINKVNTPALELLRGSRQEEQNTSRTPGVSVLEGEQETCRSSRPYPTKANKTRKPTELPKAPSRKIGIRIGSLNTKGKRFTNQETKYKDLTTLTRSNKILILR